MTADIWAQGYAAGSSTGRRDHTAERDGTWTRPGPHPDQPPNLPEPELRVWIDGFLGGYADLRGVA